MNTKVINKLELLFYKVILLVTSSIYAAINKSNYYIFSLVFYRAQNIVFSYFSKKFIIVIKDQKIDIYNSNNKNNLRKQGADINE
jgi:hypothetical protein